MKEKNCLWKINKMKMKKKIQETIEKVNIERHDDHRLHTFLSHLS